MKLENTVKASIILSAGIVVASLFIGDSQRTCRTRSKSQQSDMAYSFQRCQQRPEFSI